jgi:uncharacterized protein with von Willebrand factor type A (vWA) domain
MTSMAAQRASRHQDGTENVMHFARVLRDAGLPVGTDRILLAYEALRAGGIASRADFYSVLSACFLSRGEHRTLFDQAFHIFWKDPDLLGKIMQLLMPQMKQRLDCHSRRTDWPRRCSRAPARNRRGPRTDSGSRLMLRCRGRTASNCARRISTR